MKKFRYSLLLLIALAIGMAGCAAPETKEDTGAVQQQVQAYDGEEAYITLNDNKPQFTDEEKKDVTPFETYGDLDELGRCTTAFANICTDIMPTEKRGEIGMIKPSGWHTVKYNGLVDGNYLYNRCHLIGYQLSGENANEKNLITGTRYLNVIGMLPFEDMVADYVKETGNHVLYRVTPEFEEDNLLATGVKMEGWSVEDQGKGICFNVFCYNVQPGIHIDYATGDSALEEKSAKGSSAGEEKQSYVVNDNTKKIHLPSCNSVKEMKAKNRTYVESTLTDLEKMGYSPCQNCLGDD
ncbi:MAG: DNA/RNA non-specific endonuclease [Lachnospiraceae bacterium]|nr:DNA/RNA non-specific endonuclease [Lachnospiraceae bacterium]